jgi:hypothetical protein
VATYRFYLIDDRHRPLRVIDVACSDDDSARVAALENLNRYGATAVDLWQGLRYLEKIGLSASDDADQTAE